MAKERRHAGQKLKQKGSQTVDIRFPIVALTFQDLGAHVLGRATERPGLFLRLDELA